MGTYSIDMETYKSLARQAAAEGCVLIKNENDTLPLKKKDNVAVFGRIAYEYYKSGLGSGGLVNTRYTVGILDALKAEEELTVNDRVDAVYREWLKEHPYDSGQGWGQVPWCQEEMPCTEEVLNAAAGSDAAIVVIGRTAGEDQDNRNEPGSYLLRDVERELIKKVSAAFPRTVVLLNVGNIIDMKWVEELGVPAVLYVWQGGQEGGNGAADVLTGRVNPCGRLTDTIAENIADYPSTPFFGDEVKNIYAEDIYVGYRYFETFARQKVKYPFGYGLSYTTFDIRGVVAASAGDVLTVRAAVTNTGSVAGREVVQVYINAPQGKLGKPYRVLAAFGKTKLLAPGETEELELSCSKYTFASYDDAGVTGHKSCYVLEAGIYEVYVGADVRSAALFGTYEEDFVVVAELQEACAPVEHFQRFKPVEGRIGLEDVPIRTVDPAARIASGMPEEIPYTGDRGIRLSDVYEGKNGLDEFVAQLSEEDLIHMFRGEGMSSPKVTPGTGAAFGGITGSLRAKGIPAACCTDGPSGIRMDVGTKAFSLPNGTMLGCTFDLKLVEALYGMTGRELRANRVDALLGPGINIHRHPLNGRNFEYVSEDPLLTGKMGAAQIRGLGVVGSTGTIKHFCANNQEAKRRRVEAVVSERALREIYLKGFEISVKEGEARAVMTTYGPVNGIWTAGSYDLNTTILRNEWGFTGIVMTDWWAESNVEGQESSMKCHAPMVMAQNDLYMVTQDAADMGQDDVLEKLLAGEITRGQLQRNAKNILRFILASPAMLYEMGKIGQEELDEISQRNEEDDNVGEIEYYYSDEEGTISVDCSTYEMGRGKSIVFGIDERRMGFFDISVTAVSQLDELAQLPVTLFYDGAQKCTFLFRGSNGQVVEQREDLGMIFGKNHYIKLYFGADGIQLKEVKIIFRQECEMPF